MNHDHCKYAAAAAAAAAVVVVEVVVSINHSLDLYCAVPQLCS